MKYSKRYRIILLVALVWAVAAIDVDQEITSQDASVTYTVGAETTTENREAITDQSITSSYTTSGNISDQVIEFTIDSSVTVRGVLIHTDEAQMTAGMLQFLVDDVACYTSIEAKGGVFNCGLSGTRLKVRATRQCTPAFAITMVKVWTKDAVSADSNTQPVYLGSAVPTLNSVLGDAWKVFNSGSLTDSSDSSLKLFNVSKGSNQYPAFIIKLPYRSQIDKIVIAQANGLADIRVAVSDFAFADAFADTMDFATNVITTNSDTTDNYLSVDTNVLGAYVAVWRPSSYSTIVIQRLVAIGSRCDEATLTLTSFTPPTSMTVAKWQDTFTFDIPVYDEGCLFDTDKNKLSFNVLANRGDGAENTLGYVTNTTTKMTVDFSRNVELAKTYAGQTKTFYILASSNPSGFSTRTNDEASFSVTFSNAATMLENTCNAGTFNATIGQTPLNITSMVTPDSPTSLLLPSLSDTGSLLVGDSTGVAGCGDRKLLFDDWNLPNPFSKRLGLSIKQNTNGTHSLLLDPDDDAYIGTNGINLTVYLDEYQITGPKLVIQINVTIKKCKIEQINLDDLRDYQRVVRLTEVPAQDVEMRLPIFDMSPKCGKSEEDFDYELVSLDTGELPNWIKFDAKDRLATITRSGVYDLNNEWAGTKYSFELLISIDGASDANQHDTDRYSFLLDVIFDYETLTDFQIGPIEPINVIPEPVRPIAVDVDEERVVPFEREAVIDAFIPEYKEPEAKPADYTPTSPEVKLGKISPTGDVLINFSESVYQLAGDLASQNIGMRESSMMRHLTSPVDEDRIRKYTPVPFIEAKVVPGENSNLDNLSFEFYAEFIDSKSIKLTLEWENPSLVSIDPQNEDVLQLIMWGPFMDQEDGQFIDGDNLIIEKAIPPQIKQTSLTQLIEMASTVVAYAMMTFVILHFLLSLCLRSYSLNLVWCIINSLQVVFHAPLMTIYFPGSCSLIYSEMIRVVNFDFLPSQSILSHFITLPEKEPWNDQFARLGNYGNTYLIMSLGTLSIFFFGHCLLLLAYFPAELLGGTTALPCNMQTKMRSWRESIKSKLFWNQTIMFIQEAYFIIVISGLVNLFHFEEAWFAENTWVGISNSFTAVFLCAAVVLPPFALFYLGPRYYQLQETNLVNKYAGVYQILDTGEVLDVQEDDDEDVERIILPGDKPMTMLYPLLFYKRRLMFAFAIVFLGQYIALQLILYMVPTLAVIMLVGWSKGMYNQMANALELYNNCSILLIAYCLICLTESVSEPTYRDVIGVMVVMLTFQNIFLNLYLIAVDPIRIILKFIKALWLMRSRKKRQAERKQVRQFTNSQNKQARVMRIPDSQSDQPVSEEEKEQRSYEEEKECESYQEDSEEDVNQSQAALLRSGEVRYDSAGDLAAAKRRREEEAANQHIADGVNQIRLTEEKPDRSDGEIDGRRSLSRHVSGEVPPRSAQPDYEESKQDLQVVVPQSQNGSRLQTGSRIESMLADIEAVDYRQRDAHRLAKGDGVPDIPRDKSLQGYNELMTENEVEKRPETALHSVFSDDRARQDNEDAKEDMRSPNKYDRPVTTPAKNRANWLAEMQGISETTDSQMSLINRYQKHLTATMGILGAIGNLKRREATPPMSSEQQTESEFDLQKKKEDDKP